MPNARSTGIYADGRGNRSPGETALRQAQGRLLRQAQDERLFAPVAEGATSGVTKRIVDGEHAGRRLDNYLLSLYGDIPKSRLYRMIRTGELRVNGGRAKVDQRLAAGDLLRLPPLRNAPPVGTPPPTVSPYWREALLQGVLHEDDTLLVLDKPSGLAVHGGSGLSYGIIEALRALRPGDPYLELVHRIDRETSGILLLAKSPSMLRTLHQIFRTGNITKHYLALAVGQWPEGILTCESTLAKGIAVGGGGERLVRVDPDGKVALSRFRATERFEVQGHHFTLVEVEILTGRTHQIRVQAANTGYPLAGDPKYGNSDANRFLRDLGFDRLFLHARRVTLTLPGEGRPRIYTAPLPPDLLGFLESLRGAEGAGTPGP